MPYPGAFCETSRFAGCSVLVLGYRMEFVVIFVLVMLALFLAGSALPANHDIKHLR